MKKTKNGERHERKKVTNAPLCDGPKRPDFLARLKKRGGNNQQTVSGADSLAKERDRF